MSGSGSDNPIDPNSIRDSGDEQSPASAVDPNAVDPNRARRLELLAGQTLGDLTDEEAKELESLSGEDDQQVALELERTAAAVQLAIMSGSYEAMPEALSTRIRSQADQVVASIGARPARQFVQSETASSTGFMRSRELFAWLACAAAATVLMVSYFSGQAPKELSLATQRSVMIERGGDEIIKVSWTPGTTPFESEVTGDVVWDNATQKGFMRFKNLPVNDATLRQYQLWIIDPGRDEEPIDGGVFNCESTGEIIVPIDAKLKVVSPAAFAITVEKPGGVVVSTQENLPLLAAVQ